MTHPRKLTRDAIKDRLTGLSYQDNELTPMTNRAKELEPGMLPVAAIITDEETSERHDKRGALARTLRVMVVLVIDVTEADAIDDDLDAWAMLVEGKLKQVPIGPARQFDLVATSLDLPPVEEGEQWIGYLTLEYDARVFDDI